MPVDNPRYVQALTELAAVAQALEQTNFFRKGPDKYLGFAG